MINETPYWRLIAFITLSAFCLLPMEGYVSQVSYLPGHNLTKTLLTAQHVIKATSLQKNELFKQIIFPKTTSSKGKETIYQEQVSLYRVDGVIRSNIIKPRDIIRIREEPAYSASAIQQYHETGILESLALLTYGPLHVPKRNGARLLLLGAEMKGDRSIAYPLLGAEGLKSEAIIRKTVASQ